MNCPLVGIYESIIYRQSTKPNIFDYGVAALVCVYMFTVYLEQNTSKHFIQHAGLISFLVASSWLLFQIEESSSSDRKYYRNVFIGGGERYFLQHWASRVKSVEGPCKIYTNTWIYNTKQFNSSVFWWYSSQTSVKEVKWTLVFLALLYCTEWYRPVFVLFHTPPVLRHYSSLHGGVSWGEELWCNSKASQAPSFLMPHTLTAAQAEAY